jgi:peptide/nickel transport system permease protein
MAKSTTLPRSALWFLGFLLVLALAKDVLSNGITLRCQIQGKTHYPGFRILWKSADDVFADSVLDSIRSYKLWKSYPYDAGSWTIFAPIAFTAGEKDSLNIAQPPGAVQQRSSFQFRHWLGTDENGRDVAAGIVAGARVAMLAGLAAMSLAMLLGILLGALAGFYGDDRLRVRAGVWYLSILGCILAFLIAFVQRQYVLRFDTTGWQWIISILVFSALWVLCYGIGVLLSKIPRFSKFITIPADMMIMRLAEIFKALPLMVLLLAVVAMVKTDHTFWILIMVIGAFSWTEIALFVRADLLRVRALDYITAARGMGYPERWILWRHALPNALRSALIVAAFGFGGVILLEASLSFLGLGGQSMEGASWGSFLARGDVNFRHWWVILPAATAICLTILSVNSIGEALSKARNS